jgi:hypothetical protein
MERQLIADYKSKLDEVLASLTAGNYSIAVKIAALLDMVRGYGHVKDKMSLNIRLNCKPYWSDSMRESPVKMLLDRAK